MHKDGIAGVEAIMLAFAELDSEVEGGIKSLAKTSEELADIQELNNLNLKMSKHRQLVTRMAEKLKEFSVTLGKEGTDENDARKISLSMYYQQLSLALTIAVDKEKEEALNEDLSSTSGKKINSKLSLRRKLLGGGFGLGAAALLLGGAALSNKSEAFAGGDAALMLPALTTIAANTGAEAYGNFVQTVQNIQQVFNGLQALNDTFINGIDGLLVGGAQDSSKEVVTNVTASEKIADTVRENKQVDIEANSIVGSGTCIQDAAEAADEALTETEYAASKAAVDDVISKDFLSGRQDHVENDGDSIVRDAIDSNKSSLNSGGIARNSVASSEEDIRNSRKVYDRMIAKNSKLVLKSLDKLGTTPQGKQYASDMAAYLLRRGVAEGALARLRQGSIKEPTIYQHHRQKLEAILSSVQNTPSDSENTRIVNTRTIAMAQEMLSRLEQKATAHGGTPGISLIESLELQVEAKNNKTTYEYIRSVGPSTGALLRELIDIGGTQLKFEKHAFLAQRETNTLLSAILLEMLDSPTRIIGLNETAK